MFSRPLHTLALALLVLAFGLGQWHQMLDGLLGHGHEFTTPCQVEVGHAAAKAQAGASLEAPHDAAPGNDDHCCCSTHSMVVALAEMRQLTAYEMQVAGWLPLTDARLSDALPAGIDLPPQLA